MTITTLHLVMITTTWIILTQAIVHSQGQSASMRSNINSSKMDILLLRIMNLVILLSSHLWPPTSNYIAKTRRGCCMRRSRIPISCLSEIFRSTTLTSVKLSKIAVTIMLWKRIVSLKNRGKWKPTITLKDNGLTYLCNKITLVYQRRDQVLRINLSNTNREGSSTSSSSSSSSSSKARTHWRSHHLLNRSRPTLLSLRPQVWDPLEATANHQECSVQW